MSDQLNPIERDLLDGFHGYLKQLKQESQAEPVTCDRAMALQEQSRKQAAWWEATKLLREMLVDKRITIAGSGSEVTLFCNTGEGFPLYRCLTSAIEELQDGTS